MRPKVKIDFHGFWGGFLPEYFFRLTRYLQPHFEFEVTRDQPRFVICSVFDDPRPIPKNAVRILFTGEWAEPDMDKWDWAATFCRLDHPRHLRLPYWVSHLYSVEASPAALVRTPAQLDPSHGEMPDRFCLFLFRNDVPRRNAFFHRLHRYRPIDSPGRVLNNMPVLGAGPFEKLRLISRYKFVISFENRLAPGYVTEKLVDPLLKRTIPLYWGDPYVGEDFDTSAFFDRSTCSCDQEMVDRIIDLDRDEPAYRAMRARPCLRHNAVPAAYREESLVAWWREVFRSGGVG